jgi:hypothetical protein
MQANQTAILILSAVIVLGFGGVAIAWMVALPHTENRDIIMLIVGALATGYGQVIGYWFAKKGSDQ